MARYREEAEREAGEVKQARMTMMGIETIDKACPVCKGDVKGDDTYLFYCKRCNILFRREELYLENPERLKGIVEKKIVERYERDRDKLKIGQEPIALKDIRLHRDKTRHKSMHAHGSDSHRRHAKNEYVASKSSNKLHVANCPFAKNIKKSNRESFLSLAQAKKHKTYKNCRCID